jgi:hypothetical protein
MSASDKAAASTAPILSAAAAKLHFELGELDVWNIKKETCEKRWIQLMDMFEPQELGKPNERRSTAHGRRMKLKASDEFPLGSRVLSLASANSFRHAGMTPGIVVGKGRRFYRVLRFGPRTNIDASNPENWIAVSITAGLLKHCTKADFETKLLQCFADARDIRAAQRKAQMEATAKLQQQTNNSSEAYNKPSEAAPRRSLYARAMGLA